MNALRCVEPEWLDELPPDDARATRSRRDLQRINALMMNDAIVARTLARALGPGAPRTIAEIGAGDGTFMLRLSQQRACARYEDVHVTLVDRQDVVGSPTLQKLARRRWNAQSVTADVFEWLTQPSSQVFDVIVANLFLHHFDDAKLAALLPLVAQRSRAFVACEPRRSSFALISSRLLGALGCNDVTRHDAVVSVRAGFAGRELSALWPPGAAWTLRECAQGPFSHCFVASRVRPEGA